MDVEQEVKREGAKFWDENPCGGEWSAYADYLNWCKKTEPEMFQLLDTVNWSGKFVVDVGCGQGPALNYVAETALSVVGLDMSYQSLVNARKGSTELGRALKASFLMADVERLPFLENSIDAVIALGVLHHTENTQDSISEVHRVLKLNGQAVVMLYRSGNPKWFMTRMLRSFSKFVDRLASKPGVLAEWLRKRHQEGDSRGTALLELFGVPIMKAFSNHQTQNLFSVFKHLNIRNVSPGFRRLADILPILRPIEKVLMWIDKVTEQRWGFYQVIFVRK